MVALELLNGSCPPTPFFVTVDAETEVLSDGIGVISEIRDSIEEEEGVRLPIAWFVRLQRSWSECVTQDDPAFFERPPGDCFDGFAMAEKQWRTLCERGDELGWHYHAYHYVHRDDLSHALKMRVLNADLATCFQTVQSRHPELAVSGFRFGWFFVPDFAVYSTLSRIGIRYDASLDPARAGKKLLAYNVSYLPYFVTEPVRIANVLVFPKVRTYFIHDWTVVPHQFSWHRLGSEEAEQNRLRVKEELRRIAVGNLCTGYHEYLRSAGLTDRFAIKDACHIQGSTRTTLLPTGGVDR